MKKIVAALVLGMALIVPMGALGASSVFAQSGDSCSLSYSPGGVCVAGNGNVVVSVNGSTAVLAGTATPNTGVYLTQLPLYYTPTCANQSAVSFRVSGNGLGLTSSNGQLWWYNPANGQSYAVSSVSGSGGVYTLVFGNCAATILPTTGGGAGQPSSPSAPVLPFAVGLMLVLAGAAVTIRNRAHQV